MEDAMKNRITILPTIILMICLGSVVGLTADQPQRPNAQDSPAAGGHGRLVLMGQSANYQLLKEVISGAAVEGSSASYQMKATVGQWAAGPISSANFRMSQGFWKDIGAVYVCGDANDDAQVNVGDAVYLINFVFKGGPAPAPLCVGDANADDGTNVGDAVYLINFVFKGGPAPKEPCCP
jgi:hypothetical protein